MQGMEWKGDSIQMKTAEKIKEEIKRELKTFIETNIIMVKETQRIWGNKMDITDYERGRAEGIILCGKDTHDNLLRFAKQIGVELK